MDEFNFEGLPELDISDETTRIIKTGSSLANTCRAHAEKALVIAEKVEDYAHLFRRLALAYQQTAKKIIDEVGEAVSMEWDAEDIEPSSDEEPEES